MSSPISRLTDDLVELILFRIPPDEPERLVLAALMSKPWLCVASDAGFRKRYREFHGAPPVLGFLYRDQLQEPSTTRFVPATAFFPPAMLPDFGFIAPSSWEEWDAIDARHGRVVFERDTYGRAANPPEFLVWDPITKQQWVIEVPNDGEYQAPSAAVLCAADSCDHLDCHAGPFLLAVVYHTEYDGEIAARVYSSDTAAWSGVSSFQCDPDELDCGDFKPFRVLVGNVLYFTCACWDHLTKNIVRYDMAGGGGGGGELSVIQAPVRSFGILMSVDGVLGYAHVKQRSITLWSWEDAASAWTPGRSIKFKDLLPPPACRAKHPYVICFLEKLCALVIRAGHGVFALDLKSHRCVKSFQAQAVKEMCKQAVRVDSYIVPYLSFAHN